MITDRKVSLDERAQVARARVRQELLYYFGRAIPNLDQHGEAHLDMGALTDAILDAAKLAILQELQTKE